MLEDMLDDKLFDTKDYKTSKRFKTIQEENNEGDLDVMSLN